MIDPGTQGIIAPFQVGPAPQQIAFGYKGLQGPLAYVTVAGFNKVLVLGGETTRLRVLEEIEVGDGEKGKGVTRILRLQRGEVWARSNSNDRPIEIETPVGVLAARSAEVSVRLVSDTEAIATVIRGAAEFSTALLSCRLTAGTVSAAYRGRTCTQPTVADVRSVTGWSHPLLVP